MNEVYNRLLIEGTPNQVEEIINFLKKGCEENEVINFNNVIPLKPFEELPDDFFNKHSGCFNESDILHFYWGSYSNGYESNQDGNKITFWTRSCPCIKVMYRLGELFPNVIFHYGNTVGCGWDSIETHFIHGKEHYEEKIDTQRDSDLYSEPVEE